MIWNARHPATDVMLVRGTSEPEEKEPNLTRDMSLITHDLSMSETMLSVSLLCFFCPNEFTLNCTSAAYEVWV